MRQNSARPDHRSDWDIREAELSARVLRVLRCLVQQDGRIAGMNKGSITINFAGEKLNIRIEEFLVDE